MRDRSRALVLVSLTVAAGACGGKPLRLVAPGSNKLGDAKIVMVKPSRLLPELVGNRGLVATEEGQRRILVDRMRILARPDGSVARAAELLPGGNVSSTALPSRLGGGYLFHVNAGGGTEIWRASGWLGKLRPLARRGETVNDILPGFDRLYVRLSSGNRLIALDPETGALLPLGPLPLAGSYGQLAFADGWRAVVDTDLRGPLATFDAGLTWRPLGLREKPQAVGVVDGDPAVFVSGGRYLIDARGGVTHRTDTRPRRGDDDLEPPSKTTGPLGPRPLRAAVEDGWPESPTAALVARGGALARVSLVDGAVLAIDEDAYPERRASCHAVHVGFGFGFLCGERDGATVIYEHEAPLAMRPVMRFDKPRFVTPSGNGSLVIRGRCAGESTAVDEADARWYCVRNRLGGTREIRVKGFDLGVERVIALTDGRVVVLVPPRGGSSGDLTIVGIDGKATKVALQLPEDHDALRHLRRGLWLDGFEQRETGTIGGWVEAGGPVAGVEIGLDGKVKIGDVQADAGGGVYGGRFAVALFDGARASETSDGGMTWASFDLPDREEEARAVPSRGVSPIGAALPGWVRIGWGEPATRDDMKVAESPSSPHVPLKVSPTISLACSVSSVATPPLPDKPRPAAPPPRPRARPISVPGPGRVSASPREPAQTFTPFRNTPGPAIGAEELGIEGRNTSDPAVFAYAWGKRGADWSRVGRWLVRFDDRFDPAGGVRSAAVSTSLWADETTATAGVSSSNYPTVNWGGALDPGGRAMLAAACHGSSCALYAVAEGQPILPVRDASGRGNVFIRPFAGGAVRLGDTWFFLGQSSSYDAVSLWRVDLGVARVVGSWFRPNLRYGYDAPRLVRRALGAGLGVLVSGQPDPGEKAGIWYVLPVDPETGALGEAVQLARRDLAGVTLSRCAAEQDGWMLDLSPDTTVLVELDNARAGVDGTAMRLRLDPGRGCVDAAAATTSAVYPLEAKAPPGRGPAPAPKPLTAPPSRKAAPAGAALVPLALTEKGTGRRWGLQCQIKPPAPAKGK